MTIGIINCGVGNAGSVYKMISLFSDDVTIIHCQEDLKSLSKLVVPGVGAYDAAITHLKKVDLFDSLKIYLEHYRVPVLGICLGMQILARQSSEGMLAGLGCVPLDFKRFIYNPHENIRVPHMGWNEVDFSQECPLFSGFADDFGVARFYFAHSYYADVSEECTVARTEYGRSFTSAFAYKNFYGVQFHPEKSHRYGKKLIQNFVDLL